jgi:hypothetical protein
MSQDRRTAELERASEVSTMERVAEGTGSGFELSLPKILAGALAAAGAAVASSWLGVAGTVLGAVVGSIVVPVGTAIASRPLERSSQVIRGSLPLLPVAERAPGSAVTRRPGASVSAASPVSDEVYEASRPACQATVRRHTGASGATTRRPIRWGMLVVSCLVTLVVGFGLLTAAEEVMGRTFSSLIHGGNGGTTLSHVVHHSSGSGGGTTNNPTSPTTTAPSTGEQTTSPTTTAPTTEPGTTAPTSTDPVTTDPVTTAPPSSADPTSVGATGGVTGGETTAP